MPYKSVVKNLSEMKKPVLKGDYIYIYIVYLKKKIYFFVLEDLNECITSNS
jgi:hypothetical protein